MGGENQEPSIWISVPFGFVWLALKGLPATFFCIGPAPNVNSVGETSKVGRAKIEGVPAVLKEGGWAGSWIFGKPKLIEGSTVGEKLGSRELPLSIGP